MPSMIMCKRGHISSCDAHCVLKCRIKPITSKGPKHYVVRFISVISKAIVVMHYAFH